VSPALAVIGVAVLAGAVVAVAAHEGRPAILGLILALIAAPLVAAPLPPVLPLAARLVAAILVGYVLWIAMRGAPAHGRTRGSRLGWPVEALVAGAAAAVGFGLGGAGAGGNPEAMSVGLALTALAIPPLVRGDALQVGIGTALLVTAVEVLRVGLAGPASALEHLAASAVLAAIGAAVALLVDASIATGGSLEVADRRPGGARPADEGIEPVRPWYRPRLRR